MHGQRDRALPGSRARCLLARSASDRLRDQPRPSRRALRRRRRKRRPIRPRSAGCACRLGRTRGEPGLLAGASVIEVRAPTDDRRIEIVCERAGKFRGSRARRLTLEISMLPAARGATLREAGAPPLQSAGATRTGRGAPRPVLDRSAVQDAARRGDRAALLAARWVSPLVAGWLLARPDAAGELYEELCALPSPRASRCGARLVPFAWCDAAEPVSSLIAPEELASVAAEMAPVVADPRLRALARMRRELDRAAAAPSCGR